ncbi:MAG TPA: UDP-N-acetylmuramoyl-L-alanine--D-glutamate ligase [Acidimicrobiales bacterium]|nr:UDP-N-acetylmuramoyl-L-alanine--D-glutamate ligase [Acidimicrobiales bacterium]
MKTSEGKGKRAVVIGWGLSGRAATAWLAQNGWDVTVLEDDPKAAAAAEASGAPVARVADVAQAQAQAAARLAREADLVVPSPGVRISHPALVAASHGGVPIWSEVELAWSALEGAGGQARTSALTGARVGLVAITGTNGKTTVTELVTAMLRNSGTWAVAAGNVGYPLLEAVCNATAGSLRSLAGDGAWPETGPGSAAPPGTAVLVAEVSSFQLHYTRSFAPDVSCWLNFSPDHLDWHPSLDHYSSAKARIWANQKPGTVAVVNADDPVVVERARTIPRGVRVVSFGSPGRERAAPDGADALAAREGWRVYADRIEGPDGTTLEAERLPRAFPHDLANTAAAFAVALAAGATPEGCIAGAVSTKAPHHRLELVGEAGGVSWYDDSKATTPASVVAAVRGFRSVVLIAGGRNKGLDLSTLRETAPPVHAVIAIGESATQVADAFAGAASTYTAGSMGAAVRQAASISRPGDAVVLSPGCASFDWYSSYAERGEDFVALVKEKLREVQAR